MKTFIKWQFLLFFSLHCGALYAQKQVQAAIDSIRLSLPSQKDDSNKVKTLINLAFTEANIDPNEGLKHGLQSLKISESIKWYKGRAGSQRCIGRNYEMLDELSKAIEHYSAALKLYDSAKDMKNKGSAYTNIGGAYENSGKYPEALTNYFNALRIFESIGERAGICGAYNGIGNIYDFQHEFDKALKNYAMSIQIAKELGDKERVAGAYNNMGGVYDELGISNNYKTEYFDTALINLFAALKIKEELGNKRKIANSYNTIGNVYYHQGKYDEALKYRFDALKIFEAANSKSGMTMCYNNIGQCYLRLKKYKESEEYLLKGLVLAKEIQSMDLMKLSYKELHDLYEATSEHENALRNYELYIGLKDSLENNATTKKIMQTQMQYDFDKKEIETKAEREKKEALAKEAMLYEFDRKETGLKAEQEKKEALAKKALQYDFDKKTAATRAEQEKKNAVATEELKKQALVRNISFAGLGFLMFFSTVVYKQRNRVTKEKKRSDELLLNILPSEVADELKATGGSIAKHFDNVSVILTDFVDFTKAGERMSPQQLVNELDTCFKAFDAIIGKHNIEKIKTIGDGYLAVSGLPKADPMHAKNMLDAAIEIRDFMLARKAQIGDKTFEMRIGVHSGNVVAGIVGIKKFAYDIWGDTVNTAARMEQHCEAGKINISETTYELIKDQFACSYRGEIEAKNKGMLKMYFVD